MRVIRVMRTSRLSRQACKRLEARLGSRTRVQEYAREHDANGLSDDAADSSVCEGLRAKPALNVQADSCETEIGAKNASQERELHSLDTTSPGWRSDLCRQLKTFRALP